MWLYAFLAGAGIAVGGAWRQQGTGSMDPTREELNQITSLHLVVHRVSAVGLKLVRHVAAIPLATWNASIAKLKIAVTKGDSEVLAEPTPVELGQVGD